MNRNDQVTAIAEAFSETLRQILNKSEFAEMKHLNETDPDYRYPVCASHNFCDANMPMDAAFRDVIGRELDGDNEDDCTIWNDAWDLARKLYLGAQ